MTSHILPTTKQREFALAGNAVLTIASDITGARYTYRIRVSDDGRVHFVSVLTGSDNEADYTYLGTIRGGVYSHGRKSRIGPEAPSAVAFAWTFPRLDNLPPAVSVHHEGRCGRCGRTLTVPESIVTGLGPECAKKIAFAA